MKFNIYNKSLQAIHTVKIFVNKFTKLIQYVIL